MCHLLFPLLLRVFSLQRQTITMTSSELYFSVIGTGAGWFYIDTTQSPSLCVPCSAAGAHRWLWAVLLLYLLLLCNLQRVCHQCHVGKFSLCQAPSDWESSSHLFIYYFIFFKYKSTFLDASINVASPTPSLIRSLPPPRFRVVTMVVLERSRSNTLAPVWSKQLYFGFKRPKNVLPILSSCALATFIF